MTAEPVQPLNPSLPYEGSGCSRFVTAQFQLPCTEAPTATLVMSRFLLENSPPMPQKVSPTFLKTLTLVVPRFPTPFPHSSETLALWGFKDHQSGGAPCHPGPQWVQPRPVQSAGSWTVLSPRLVLGWDKLRGAEEQGHRTCPAAGGVTGQSTAQCLLGAGPMAWPSVSCCQ